MTTRITLPGTIDNTGDIQPDFLPLPDWTVLEAGDVPPSRHPAVHAATGAHATTFAAADPDRSPLVTASAAGAASGSFGSPAAPTGTIVATSAASSGYVAYAPLVIKPRFGSSITGLTGTGGDPTTAAEVEGAIRAAINYYETFWTSDVPIGTVINGATINSVTISIEFDYGTLAGKAMTSGSGASESQYGLITIGNGSYATLYSTLSGELPDLPATDPTDGSGMFFVTQAQSQLLGTGATVTGPAGYVGINSIKNGVTLDYNLADQSIAGEIGAVGAIEHEMSEIMGRNSDLGMDLANTYTLFDLYRFKGPGTPALTAGAADYFSLNSGTTAAGYFNNHPANGGDAGDWDSSGTHNVAADAFDAFLTPGTAGTISNLDSLVLGAIGLREAPRTFLWTGTAGTSFSAAADWNDLTDALNPSQIAPAATDTAQFLGVGGTITGTGTAATLIFAGAKPWELTADASLSATSAVNVGTGGTGTLTINDGASIAGLGSVDTISGAAGEAASVTVDGTGSKWQSAGELVVGNSGTGSLTVSNGGGFAAATNGVLPAMVLGANSGGDGLLTVAGAGSEATLLGQINVGQSGTGSLLIENQGTVITGGAPLAPSQGVDIAENDAGSGSVTVSGSGALLSNTGQFIVGYAGVGNLTVAAGGIVVTTPGSVAGLVGLSIADTTAASGSTVNVSGSQSQLNVTGTLDVGSTGSGALLIGGGATVTAGALDAGTMAGSVGQIELSGSGTELSVSGAITLADAGTTVLSVTNGATLAAADLSIGTQSNGSGAVLVSGTGSVLQLAGTLNVGTTLGTGELTVGPGGAVHAAVINLQGQVALEGGLLDPTVLLINQGVTAGGFGTIEAGDMIDESVIQASATPDGAPEVLRGTVMGGGTLDCNGTVTTNAPGVLQINTGGTMELTGAVLNAAATSFADDLTPAGHYSLNHSQVDVCFAGSSGVLRLDDIAGFAGTIASVHHGDQFVIAGGTLSGLNVSNGNTLTMFDKGLGGGVGGTDQLVFATAITSAGFDIVNGDTVQMACFAAGTLIDTGHGSAPVQNLAVGDQVRTLLGGTGRIIWVGSRVVDCRRHQQPELVWPVRIERGAFGENIPSRDLLLSPDHAVYLAGVLIPVKLLVNCSAIRQIEVDRIVYHHIELEQHDVILAEGLAAETYLDVGDRYLFSGDPVTAAIPEFPARLWEMAGCAPLVQTGAMLHTVRLALAERSERLVGTTNTTGFAGPPDTGVMDCKSTATEMHRFSSNHMTDVPSPL